MINVTADFAPHDGWHIWPYQLGDFDTVGHLKDAVSADPNTPVHNQPRANIDVTDAAGNVLPDATALVDQATYEVDLVGAAVGGGHGDGTAAPPGSPAGGGDGDGGHGGGGPHLDGVIHYVYFHGIADGPFHFALAPGSHVAALKAAIATDQSSPMCGTSPDALAVYDGSRWLDNNDSLVADAYTVQRLP
jgi:hypothetical protein